MRENEPDWEGRAVFVIALCVGVAFIVGVVTVAMSPTPLKGDTANAIAAGFAGMIGIIGGYVVGKRKREDK